MLDSFDPPPPPPIIGAGSPLAPTFHKMSNEPRFSDRPVTLQEMVWAYRSSKREDTEAFAKLLMSRRVDPEFDVMSLSGAELESAIAEMTAGIEAAGKEAKAWQEMVKVR